MNASEAQDRHASHPASHEQGGDSHSAREEHDHASHASGAEEDHTGQAGQEHEATAVHPQPAAAEHGDPHAGHDQMAGTGHEDHAGHTDHTGHELLFRNRFWVCLVLTVPVLLYSPVVQEWLRFTMPAFAGSQWISPLFAVVIFLVGGVPFLRMAGDELRQRQPGMMMLISLAIGVAFLYSLAALVIDPGSGFFWELVTLIDVMLLGHWLEMRSVRQSSRALDELAELLPDTAERLRADGTTEEVPATTLRADDLVLVRPGASVPADGLVVDGESDVDEALITGESLPVSKQSEDRVIAGTINGDGSLRVQVTATGDETALAGIMRLVAEAQQSKSRTQVLADRAAAWLFYIAIVVAALAGVGWLVAVGLDVEVIKRVATVLVIACPHALGLAVPLVVAITTALAARSGILVRDRLALETIRDVEVVVFDKTGTLTKGEQGVATVAVVAGWEEDRALALTAAVEGDSEHMIARGIRQAAEERSVALPSVTSFEALKGRGIRATSDGHTVHVGGPRLLELLGRELPEPLRDFAVEAGSKGQSVVYLIQDEEVVAGLALADVVRPESHTAVQQLHTLGIEVAMLTGDSAAVAQTVATELGIDRYFAEVLPEQKDQQVAELQAAGQKVAMVGDGVNDAPALTRADVGIAIGSGTDVAVESAGIILVQSNPLDVVKAIQLSRASYGKMIQNLLWATGYNIVALPLAAGVLAPIGVLLSPAIGALFMSLSTIIVAINAQLLRRVTVGV